MQRLEEHCVGSAIGIMDWEVIDREVDFVIVAAWLEFEYRISGGSIRYGSGGQLEVWKDQLSKDNGVNHLVKLLEVWTNTGVWSQFTIVGKIDRKDLTYASLGSYSLLEEQLLREWSSSGRTSWARLLLEKSANSGRYLDQKKLDNYSSCCKN